MRNAAVALALAAALSACASRTAAALNGVAAVGFTAAAAASGECNDDCIVDGRGIFAIPATAFALAALACLVAASPSPTQPRKTAER